MSRKFLYSLKKKHYTATSITNLLIQRILKKGKKKLVKLIVSKTFGILFKKTSKNPVYVLEKAIRKITPKVYIVVFKIPKKKSPLLIPTGLSRYSATLMAINWLISCARNRSGKTFSLKLANEILDASKKASNSFQKKEELHKFAESNKFFLKFREQLKDKKGFSKKLRKIIEKEDHFTRKRKKSTYTGPDTIEILDNFLYNKSYN